MSGGPTNAAFLGRLMAVLGQQRKVSEDVVALDLLATYGGAVRSSPSAEARAICGRGCATRRPSSPPTVTLWIRGTYRRRRPAASEILRLFPSLSIALRDRHEGRHPPLHLGGGGGSGRTHPPRVAGRWRPADMVVLIRAHWPTPPFDDPQQFSSGITLVVVNGQIVLEHGSHRRPTWNGTDRGSASLNIPPIGKVPTLILDVHTHAMATEHWGLEWEKNWEPVYRAPAHATTVEAYDQAMAGVDTTFVFGLRATRAGVATPHDWIADFVQKSITNCVGFMALDPSDDDVLEQLRYGVQLGLRGIKLYPVLAHFDPRDEAFDPFYRAATDAGLIVLWHMGATPSPEGRLDVSQPLVVDEVARRHPGLTQIIAHMGHPWQRDTMVVIRKNRRVFSDVSACWARPADGHRALIRAQEWGVVEKLLFGSDYPIWTPADAISGLRSLAEIESPTGAPTLNQETLDWILTGDQRPALGIEH